MPVVHLKGTITKIVSRSSNTKVWFEVVWKYNQTYEVIVPSEIFKKVNPKPGMRVKCAIAVRGRCYGNRVENYLVCLQMEEIGRVKQLTLFDNL